MPQANLSMSSVSRLMGTALSPAELEEILFRTKVEPVEVKDDELRVEVTHDRLDLLCESGIANLLHGLQRGKSLAPLPEPSPVRTPVEVRVDPATDPLRSHLRMVVAHAPGTSTLDVDLLSELIRFQEVLHTSLGFDRREGSLGIYPMKDLEPPFVYTMERIADIRFTPLPLDGTPSREVGGKEFFEGHPMALKYGGLGRQGESALTLRDHAGHLLSLPPTLNSARHGQVEPGESEILIESTGRNPRTVRDMVGYLLLPFAARGWTFSTVALHSLHEAEGGSPLELRRVEYSPAALEALLGRPVPTEVATKALASFGMKVHSGTPRSTALVPPWRPDILGEVDLAEEIMIHEGLSTFSAEENSHATRGRRLPFSRYCDRLTEVLLGMGYQEVHTPVLISERAALEFGLPESYLRISNPVSEDLGFVRTTLLPSLLGVLAANADFGYPQHIQEIAEVVVPDKASEIGSNTFLHLGAVCAGDGAGFAAGMALAERLLRVIGMPGIKEPCELPGAIRGRSARIRLVGEPVAVVGEIHPEVLAAHKIPAPVCWVEFDLSLIWRLSGHT